MEKKSLFLLLDEEQNMFVIGTYTVLLWLYLLVYRNKSPVIGGWAQYIWQIFLSFVVMVIIYYFIIGFLRLKRKLVIFLLCILSPIGGLIVYYSTDKRREMVLFCTVIMIVYVGLQIFCLKYHSRGRRLKNPIKTYGRIMCHTVQVFLGVLLLSLSALGAWEGISINYQFYSQKELLAEIMPVTSHIWRSNQNILCKFTKKNWAAMSRKQRQDACYQLSQLECLYFTGKVSTELHFLIGRDFKQRAGGFYNDDAKVIVGDEQFLTAEYRDHAIELVCHESYHYLQHLTVKNGKKVDLHNLIPEKHIVKYEEEEKDYIDVNVDYEGYRSQLIEKDAYNYEKAAVNQYIKYIDSHFE